MDEEHIISWFSTVTGMTGSGRVTSLVLATVFFWVAEGYAECSNGGHELGECMPESQCRNLGGVKGYNNEHRCVNDVQSNEILQEKHVYCTTNAHLAKDLCSIWLPHWADNDESCSLMALSARRISERIVGGKNAKKGEFKHMVATGRFGDDLSYKWECGGALISPTFVLTAAHCVNEKGGKYVVKVGEYDMSNPKDTKKNVIKMELPAYLHRSSEYNQELDDMTRTKRIINVKKVIKHPNYLPKRDDIALLELEEQVLLNAFVLPACIPFDIEDQPKAGQNLTVSGWGHKKYGGNRSIKLKKVDLPVVESNDCQDIFHKKKFTETKITPKHLCAGKEGFDTCQGDSGGALGQKVSREDGEPCGFEAIGIVSYGDRCGLIGVYTRVSSYVNWIMQYLTPAHYNQYISENINAAGLEFDGTSMIQFNINEDIFTNGFRIQLYFKTKEENQILILVPTTEGSNITMEMENGKVVFRETIGNLYLESRSSYADNEWHYLTVECRIHTEHCYLKISEESLEEPWSLPSSSEEGLVDTLFMGGIGIDKEENRDRHFKGSLVYSLYSSLKLKSIKSSYGTVIANNGSSPAVSGGDRDGTDLAVLHLEHREMANKMILIERLLQDISAKLNRIIPDISDSSPSSSSSSECIPSFTLLSGTAECLFFGKMPLTLLEAKTSCQIMGGKLAMPDDLAELQAYMLSHDLQAYHWVDGNSTIATNNNQAVHNDCWEISNDIHIEESCLQYHPSKDGYCNSNLCGVDTKARYICKSAKIRTNGTP